MRYLLATSALSLSLTCAAAVSGPICGDRDDIVGELATGYDEAPQSTGLTDSGNLLEVFTSSQGTWTVLLTTPRGQTCIVAVGEAWEDVAKPFAGA